MTKLFCPLCRKCQFGTGQPSQDDVNEHLLDTHQFQVTAENIADLKRSQDEAWIAFVGQVVLQRIFAVRLSTQSGDAQMDAPSPLDPIMMGVYERLIEVVDDEDSAQGTTANTLNKQPSNESSGAEAKTDISTSTTQLTQSPQLSGGVSSALVSVARNSAALPRVFGNVLNGGSVGQSYRLRGRVVQIDEVYDPGFWRPLPKVL